MAISALSTILLRILNGNLIDVDFPIYFNNALTSYKFEQGVVITGSTAITLPASPLLFIYLKCLTGPLQVTWTATGNAGVVVEQMQASAFLLNANSSGGVTALTLAPTGASASFDMLIGG